MLWFLMLEAELVAGQQARAKRKDQKWKSEEEASRACGTTLLKHGKQN
jgi:hypothetical protein